MEVEEHTDNAMSFFLRSAKAWQNYFETRGLLPGITPTREQISIIQQDEKQMLINGSAGSGKSITLLYKMIKAMEQEKQPQRILYVTFNNVLLSDARKRANQSPVFRELKEKHTLHMWTFHEMAYYFLKEMGFRNIPRIDTSLSGIKKHEDKLLRRIMAIHGRLTESDAHRRLPREEQLFNTHTGSFILEEILWMKANGYITKDVYFNIERKGRSQNPRLTKAQRNTIYTIYEEYQREMKEKYHNDMDMEDYALMMLRYFGQIPQSYYYDYIFVDEVQDLQPMQIKVLVQLAKKSIILTGDQKQRIYKRSPHTYAELGLQIQGRKNRTLRQNFRSTEQIMNLANALEFEDLENDREDQQVFVRQGDKPELRYYQNESHLHRFIVNEIHSILEKDPSSTIAVIHRFEEEIFLNANPPKVKVALDREFYLITTEQYNKRFDYQSDKKPVFFTDAYSIKGLEFDYVFILQFDKQHYPHHKRIEELDKRSESKEISSESYNRDYDAIFNDEKKILYVAITRAKKKVYLLWTGKKDTNVSQFIRDFNIKDYVAYNFAKSKYRKQEKFTSKSV